MEYNIIHDPPAFRPAARRDCSEAAFRKYESIIALACKQSIVIEPRSVSPGTFVSKLREAMRGYRTYGYASDQIPKGFNLKRIKVILGDAGRVWIRNLDKQYPPVGF